MKKDYDLTQDSFDSLLRWLDPDRDQAGLKYEKIRGRLIKIFSCRGCSEASELADETINRVVGKVAQIAPTYTGEPAAYFSAVAHKVHLEYLRRRAALVDSAALDRQQLGTVESDPETEAEYACLEQCMNHLAPDSRNLVLDYYQSDKRAKINSRKRIANELGIGLNALRIRAYRIRMQLQQCVQSCLEQSPVH